MECNVDEYIKKYIKENIVNQDYNLNDIYVIIAHYLNISKEKLYLQKANITLNSTMSHAIDELLDKLYKQRIPIQYITNTKYFYNEQYFVNENVLIPRQDTEILVETAIRYVNNENLDSLLDMCTGSGCIGISIAKNSSIKEITMVDISSDALDIALKNAKINQVEKKLTLIQSNLFENVINSKYDVLVSNPPYIKTEVINSLDEFVKKEPILALDGGKSGLDIYIKILENAWKYLNNNALVIFEIGYDQLDSILTLIAKNTSYEVLECIKDFGNNDRVVVCRFHQI